MKIHAKIHFFIITDVLCFLLQKKCCNTTVVYE
jgi:hypothetical protein